MSSSTESSDSDSSSEFSSSSGSDSDEPGPSKKAKCQDEEKVKKSPPPHKVLAKLAAKKGDNESTAQLKKNKKRAREIKSEKAPDMEEMTKEFEKCLQVWKKKGVEDHAVVRMVGRVLAQLKNLGFMVSVDHAVFKKEIGVIRLMEMDIEGTLNSSGPTNREEIKRRAGDLFDQVVDGDCANRLQRTWEGNAWILREDSINSPANTSITGMSNNKFLEMRFTPDFTYF